MSRTVVITGTSDGIGKALKALYLAAGDTVVGLCRHPEAGDVYCDVSDPASVRKAFEEVGARCGRIDLLVNNAGLGISGATELIDPDKARYVFEVDYFGVFECCREALKRMGAGGRIVNISSACALFALPFRTVYCAAKAAVNMLSEGLRMELAAGGITVVTVCPGDVKTGFTKNRIKEKTVDERYGDASERAAAKIDAREHKRMDVKKVARTIKKICDKKSGPLYIVGGKYKFLYFLKRVFPERLFLYATNRMFNGGKK